jgi:hypothetical protein
MPLKNNFKKSKKVRNYSAMPLKNNFKKSKKVLDKIF